MYLFLKHSLQDTGHWYVFRTYRFYFISFLVNAIKCRPTDFIYTFNFDTNDHLVRDGPSNIQGGGDFLEKIVSLQERNK